MKKTLILIIGAIILILTILAGIRGINVGKASVYSIKQIKESSLYLDTKVEEANTETNQNYAQAISLTDESIKKLKNAKEEYETKVAPLTGNNGIGITQIEKYKIEYIWNKLGSYAKDEGIKIILDFEETTISDTYNIKFSLSGSYVGITNFIYHIENDDELNYKVTNFKIEPSASSQTSTDGKTTTTVDTNKLNATFVVESIIINFN
mgnify:CR=1 FL=1